MSEIEHISPDVVNRVPEHFRQLLNTEHLTMWTLDREAEHGQDTADYMAIRAAFQTALRGQRVAGDGRYSAQLRARKVDKHLKALVKASRAAAKAAAALRLSYVDHTRTVAALPEQRAEKAARRAERRQSAGDFAAKSLDKSRSALLAKAPDSDDSAAQGQQEPDVRGVNDLFRKGA